MPRLLLGTLTCALVMVAGSIGPWVHITVARATATYSGVDNTGDGFITIVLGIAGAVASWWAWHADGNRRWRIFAAIFFGLAAIIAWDRWSDISRVMDGLERENPNAADGSLGVSAGWGLQLTATASMLATLLALLMLRRPRVPFGIGTSPDDRDRSWKGRR